MDNLSRSAIITRTIENQAQSLFTDAKKPKKKYDGDSYYNEEYFDIDKEELKHEVVRDLISRQGWEVYANTDLDYQIDCLIEVYFETDYEDDLEEYRRAYYEDEYESAHQYESRGMSRSDFMNV